jgi:hypothetical protein
MDTKLKQILLDHNCNINRWWFYKYVGRTIEIKATVESFGKRKKKYPKLGYRDTILLSNITHENEKEVIDHLWIDRTKRLKSMILGEVISISGLVKTYIKKDNTLNFRLIKCRRKFL